MNPNEYQKLALRTECDQLKSSERLTVGSSFNPMDRPRQFMSLSRVRLNHAVTGMTGELGELATALEGWVYYGKDLNINNVKEELGDLCWYIAEACNALNLSFSDVLKANIEKLKVRYPEKYTDELAANRDLEAEAKALNTTIIPEVTQPDEIPDFTEEDRAKLAEAWAKQTRQGELKVYPSQPAPSVPVPNTRNGKLMSEWQKVSHEPEPTWDIADRCYNCGLNKYHDIHLR